jgi:hypothetical protein
VHGASSYHWVDDKGCVAFTLRGRTALALGDPIGPPEIVQPAARDFVAFCDRQDWIPAFYQVDEAAPYRSLGLTLIPIGAEALLQPATFGLAGRKRADLRYAVHRCQKEGVRFVFAPGPQVLVEHAEQLQGVSGRWLQSHRSPELGYSLGTLATLSDPDIVVGLAFAADGRLEAFVSWLPVPMRRAWTLDLMRRRPDSTYGVTEALIVRSIEEARNRGIAEVSLGMTPRVIASQNASHRLERAWRAMYWGLDRFQRSQTLHRFKEKFGPRWEDCYLVVPSMSTLPEVMVALVRAHLPPASATAASLPLAPSQGASGRRPPGSGLGDLGLGLSRRFRRARYEGARNTDDQKDREDDQRDRLGKTDAQRGVERVGAGAGEGDGCRRGEDRQVELVTAFAVEETLGQVDECDGHQHRCGDGEAGKRGQESKREAEPTPEFGKG